MSAAVLPLKAPPPGAPDVPHQAAFWARIEPDPNASSEAVDHISNVEFVRWLDAMGQAHLAELGWTSDDLVASGAMWFVARHEIDYRREAHAGDHLVAATWVRTLRRVKSWRDVMVWRLVDNDWELVCTATTLWVHVDLESRRSTQPPEAMAAALAPLALEHPHWAQGLGRR